MYHFVFEELCIVSLCIVDSYSGFEPQLYSHYSFLAQRNLNKLLFSAMCLTTPDNDVNIEW
jgi:hypothetical protein